MPFQARWAIIFESTAPPRDPLLHLSGSARSYAIDWGDGTRTVATFDRDDPGSRHHYSGLTGHSYGQGSYDISVTPGRGGPTFDNFHFEYFVEAQDDLALSGSNAIDLLWTGSGADRLRGGDGSDLLYGGDGDDRLIGGNATTRRGDDDQLFGGFGDDVLIGRVGDDVLEGGNGKDRLIGGDGADTFTFLRPIVPDYRGLSSVDADQDTVVDFVQGEDTLDISGWRYLRDFNFIGEGEFSGIRNRAEVRFEHTPRGDTIIIVDRDGDAEANMMIRLSGEVDLTQSDFVF
jgi:Ca2+-binding RTX toxin-like protein